MILLVRQAMGRRAFSAPMQRGKLARSKPFYMLVNPGFIVYAVVFVAMCVVGLYAA